MRSRKGMKFNESLLTSKIKENLKRVKNNLDREGKATAIAEALNFFDSKRDWVTKINRDEIISLITNSPSQDVLCESIIEKVNATPFAKSLKESKKKKESKKLNEGLNKKPLREGPGAGYTVRGAISSLSDIKVIDVKEGKNDYDDDIVTVSATANCRIHDVSASSYYYGRAIVGGAEIPATFEINFTYYASDFNGESPEQVVKYYNDFVFECGIGGGWTHVTFDGVIEGDYNDVKDDPYGCDTNTFKIVITNENVIKDIDKAVTGEDWVDQYDVIDIDGDIVDSFDNQDDAIAYAKKNGYVEVEHQQWRWALMSDFESEDTVDEYNEGTVWERDYEKQYKFDDDDMGEAFDKRDLYVNDKYVCSSNRYNSNKDFRNKVMQDRKVKYAGNRAIATSGVEMDELDINQDDVVKVRKAKREAYDNEAKNLIRVKYNDAWYIVDEDTDEEVDGPFDTLKDTEDYGYGHLEYICPRSDENLKEAKDDLQTKATKLMSVKKYYIDMAWKNGKTWKTDPMTLDEIAKSVEADKIEEKQFVDMMSNNIKGRKDAKNLTKAEIVKVYDYMDGKWQGKDVLWSINETKDENLQEGFYDYIDNEYADILDKDVDVYDIKQFVLNDTNNEFRTHYADEYAIITAPNGKGCVVDYEAVGQDFDNLDSEIEFGIEENKDNEYTDEKGVTHKTINIFATHTLTTTPKEVMEKAPKKTMKYRDFFRKYKYNDRCAKNFEELVSYIRENGGLYESCHSKKKRTLKEGYIGQTLEDFFYDCVDAGIIGTVSLWGDDDEIYNGDYDGAIDEYGDNQFIEFDCGMDKVVINVDTSEEYQVTDYFVDVQDFLEVFNGDEIEVFDLNTGETLFSGDRYDLPDDVAEKIFVSFDAPKFISINIEEDGDSDDDDDFDESLKEALGKIQEVTKAVDCDGNEFHVKPIWKTDRLATLVGKDGKQTKVEIADLRQTYDLYDQDGDVISRCEDYLDEGLKEDYKVGDKVYIKVNWQEDGDKTFGEIKEITPDGKYILTNIGGAYPDKKSTPISKEEIIGLYDESLKEGADGNTILSKVCEYKKQGLKQEEIVDKVSKELDVDKERVTQFFRDLQEDTVKQDGKWVNKGNTGETHGEFKTKKEADKQRKAMFVNKKPNAKWGK